MIEVVDAKHMEKYSLWIKFNNGVSGKVDLENELWGNVFEPLKNIDEFKKFTVSKDFGTIVWENRKTGKSGYSPVCITHVHPSHPYEQFRESRIISSAD